MEIYFILYKPAVPGNVGASARAVKTMGFHNLRLVKPCDHLSVEARTMAHASGEILEKAELFDHFSEAVADLDFLVGTSAKKRSVKEDNVSARELSNFLKAKTGSVKKIGIVFGTEESGLPNHILNRCDIASGVPLDNPYPSLNLSQAVMIYAYELSGLASCQQSFDPVASTSYIELKSRIRELLPEIGIPAESPLYSRILERISFLTSTDINLLHSVSSKLKLVLKAPPRTN